MERETLPLFLKVIYILVRATGLFAKKNPDNHWREAKEIQNLFFTSS